MSVRRKDRQLAGNGGQWATYAVGESAVDIDHLWGSPAESEIASPALVEPETPSGPCEACDGVGGHTGPSGAHSPCIVCEETGFFPGVTPLEVGTDSGLIGPGRYSGQTQPVLVTEHNADLVAMLTQEDINEHSPMYRELREIERERLRNSVIAADVTLPENPTPDDIARVAENIDKAFTDQVAYLSGQDVDARRVLRDVYGTEDRALVAVGAAVAARADVLASGSASGGAEATEERWLERCARLEAEEKANFVSVHRERFPELSEEDVASRFWKSADLVEIEAARDPKTRQALADLADSYTAALSEVRPMGGDVALHPDSSKPGAKVIASTGHVWPSDWVERSNDCEVPLHIGTSIKRAHYIHEHVNEITKRGQGEAYIRDLDVDSETVRGPMGISHLTRFPELDDENNPVPRQTWYQGDRVSTYATYEKLSAEERAERGYETDDNSYRVREWEFRDQETAHKEYKRYLLGVARVSWTSFSSELDELSELPVDELETKLRRGGVAIKKHPVIHGGVLVTDPLTNRGKPFYRKPKTRQNKVKAEPMSTIQLSKDWTSGPKGRDDRYAPAVHELGHRMEYLVPNLNQMARSWRDRRVSESPSEEGQELRTIYRGTSEKGYTDEFVSHYIGRSYDDRRDSIFHKEPRGAAAGFVEATEVFSMGSDSVFGGRNGGLVGLSRDKAPDLDMRNFILGVFASAGRWKGGA